MNKWMHMQQSYKGYKTTGVSIINVVNYSTDHIVHTVGGEIDKAEAVEQRAAKKHVIMCGEQNPTNIIYRV